MASLVSTLNAVELPNLALQVLFLLLCVALCIFVLIFGVCVSKNMELDETSTIPDMNGKEQEEELKKGKHTKSGKPNREVISKKKGRKKNDRKRAAVKNAEESLCTNRANHLPPKMTREQKRNYYIRKNQFTIEHIHPLSEDPKNTCQEKDVECAMDAEMSKKISIWRGDITRLEIDAVVNAANHNLEGGAGVDGAIHRAAGPDLLKENKGLLKECPTGEAKVAAGYKLPAYYVIHTTGPQDGSSEMLERCYKSCLSEVLNNNIRTVAFPGISTGIYRFPLDEATHIAAKTVKEWLKVNLEKVDRIIFCVFLDDAVEAAYRIIPQYFPKYRQAAERVQD